MTIRDRKKPIHFLNGSFVTEKELLVSPRDLGFSRAYAVFDFIVTYPYHRPFMLSRHIDRLYQSADLIGLTIPWNKQKVTTWVLETLGKNTDKSEKGITIIISGGVSYTMLPPKHPTVMIIVDPRNIPLKEDYEKGIAVVTDKFTRSTPGAKTTDYLEAVKQAQLREDAGAMETIYYDDNQVLEGSGSSVFAVINNKLLTPKSNILSGITREVLLEIIHLDIPVEAKNFTLNEFLNASEVFVTGTSKEISPVIKIDGKNVGDGQVGKITKEIIEQFRAYIFSDKW